MTSVQIAALDVPDSHGYVIPTYVVEEWLSTLPEPKVVHGSVGMPGFPYRYPRDDISHVVTNLRIEDGYLIGDVVPNTTRWGYILSHLPPMDYALAYRGTTNGKIITTMTDVAINAVTRGTKM